MENNQNNNGHYPKTAIELCVISYLDLDQISDAVSNDTGLKVVWGPAELEHWDDIAYSLMYIANNPSTDEYYVVIRGTNFLSLSSWLEQDFAVGTTQPFAGLYGQPPNVPGDALISQGTFNGMSDLISMTDPSTGTPAIEFLRSKSSSRIYVTGHSLGGTLTPAMYAYINAMLYGSKAVTNMNLWSFAGLTAGGTGFNNYFNSLMPSGQARLWRYHNNLDIAPFCWYSQSSIENIYSSHDLHWSILESEPVGYLFSEANSANIGYAQPQSGQVLQGHFVDDFPDDDLWSAQALHQHHSTTYQQLVQAMYP